MLRTGRALVVLMALTAATACGDGDSRSPETKTSGGAGATGASGAMSTSTAAGANEPVLLVAGDGAVRLVAGDKVSTLVTIERAGAAMADGTGAVVVEQLSEGGGEDGPVPVALLRFRRGSNPVAVATRPGSSLYLFDAGLVGGRPRVLYGYLKTAAGEEPEGDIVLAPLEGGPDLVLGSAFAPEFSTNAGSLGGDLVVQSAYTDLTEGFDFYTTSGGKPTGLANPTDDLEYNMPPALAYAVLSPDGLSLGYLSGPDYDGQQEKTVGSWEVVVAGSRSGKETLRAPVPVQGAEPSRLDFDGRWLVVSRVKGEAPQPALVFDTANPGGGFREVAGAVGTATLVVGARP